MKKSETVRVATTRSELHALWNKKTELSLVTVAVLLTACGGGGGGPYDNGGQPGQNVYQSEPILAVGMRRQYVGSVSRVSTYATQSGTNVNNTLIYNFTEDQNVYQAPPNAPAYFDVNSVYTYTILQDPGVGVVPVSQTVDDYRNLIYSGSSQASSELAQTSTVVSTDESANTLGGGPYTETTVTSSTFTTPRNGFYYPLQSGDSMNVPQSSSQNIAFSDLNAASASPPNGSNIGYTRVRTASDDGSYTFQQTGVTGIDQTYTENSDGSGNYSVNNPNTNTVTATTVSIPMQANSVYTIPVVRAVTSATPSTNNYSAADWYPLAGLPPRPLILETETVVGPATILPAQCDGAFLLNNIYQINTVTTSLNTLSGSYAVTQTQTYTSNGETVCSIANETSNSYSLLTGALFSTTTTQTVTLLNATN